MHASLAALKSVRYAPSVANWPEIATAAWRGEETTRLRLRSDPLRADATVIDIGANIGMFALYAAVHGRAARMFCYEPFSESFGFLRRNGERNKLRSMQPFQLAVA